MGRYAGFMPPSGGGGRSKYINLRDGDSVRFVLPPQDPGMEETWWHNGAKVEHDHPEAKRSQKAVLSVYDLDQRCPRILRLTLTAWKMMVEKLEKHGDDRPYTLSRSKGANGFPQYSVDHEDRLDRGQLDTILREPILCVLDEQDVSEWPSAPVAKPAVKQPPKPTAAAKARPVADDDIPF